MSQVVTRLVQRLATPAVASGLAKEELCLALAAAAQLKPDLPTLTDASASSSTFSAEPLARRSLRVIPHCAPQEVRMIAHGARALQWSTSASSTFVVDALVQGLYRHVKNHSLPTTTAPAPAAALQRGGRARLADVLAVAALAMDAQEFFNATLYVLITQHVEALACNGATLSSAAAEELVAVVCAYLGKDKGVTLMQRLCKPLSLSSAGPSPGKEVLDKCAAGLPLPLSSAWSATYTGWAQEREDLLASFSPASLTDTSHPAKTQKQKAKHDVLRTVRRLLEEAEEEAGSAAGDDATAHVADDALSAALEEVRVFGIYDPVTTETLDAVLLKRLRATTSTTALTYESHVYAQAQRFPRTLSMLRERDAAAEKAVAGCDSSSKAASSSSAASEALQHVSAVERGYQNAVAGAAISDKDLFLIGDDIHSFGADDTARAIFVFASSRDIPSNLIVVLADAAGMLTVNGIVALLRAARRDRAGALRTVVDTCLKNAAHLQQCVAAASVESLVDLASVLAEPHTRWSTTPAETTALEAQLTELALAQLYLHLDAMPWESLLCVVRGIGKIPDGQDMVRAACDRLATQLQSSVTTSTATAAAAASFDSLKVSKCFDVLEALQLGDVMAERLLDVLAAALSTSFQSLASAAADDARLASFLRLVALESTYASPQLAEVIAKELQAVTLSKDWDAVPVELLVASALFALDRGNVTSSYAAMLTLPHRVLHHIQQSRRLSENLTANVAAAVVDVVSRVTLVDAEVAAYCVEAVLPVAATLSTVTTARLVCAAHRVLSSVQSQVSISKEITVQLTTSMRGLPPDVFTSLCASASGPLFDEALSNGLVETLPLVVDRLTPRQLSRCVFGLGEMRGAGQRLSHQIMTEALSDYVVDNVELFTSGRDIASLLHGFAKLQCTKRNLYSVFAKQLNKRFVRFTLDFQSISFLLFAFGSVKFVDQKMINSFCEMFVRHVDDLAAPDLLLALRGVSRMCLLNSPFYWKLGEAVARKADELPLQAQCELLHAFGSLEQRHPKMATALASRIVANISSLPSASTAVDVLASLWMMDCKVSGNVDMMALADHVVQRQSELNAEDLTKLCGLIQSAQLMHRPLLNAIASRSVELNAQGQLEATVARAVLDTLAHRLVFHVEARTELSKLARSVSKEVVQLSGDEQEQLNLLTGP